MVNAPKLTLERIALEYDLMDLSGTGSREFHEMGITNATRILEAQGKLKGRSIKPWSTGYSKTAAIWGEL